jgi:hypothetical protein
VTTWRSFGAVVDDRRCHVGPLVDDGDDVELEVVGDDGEVLGPARVELEQHGELRPRTGQRGDGEAEVQVLLGEVKERADAGEGVARIALFTRAAGLGRTERDATLDLLGVRRRAGGRALHGLLERDLQRQRGSIVPEAPHVEDQLPRGSLRHDGRELELDGELPADLAERRVLEGHRQDRRRRRRGHEADEPGARAPPEPGRGPRRRRRRAGVPVAPLEAEQRAAADLERLGRAAGAGRADHRSGRHGIEEVVEGPGGHPRHRGVGRRGGRGARPRGEERQRLDEALHVGVVGRRARQPELGAIGLEAVERVEVLEEELIDGFFAELHAFTPT